MIRLAEMPPTSRLGQEIALAAVGAIEPNPLGSDAVGLAVDFPIQPGCSLFYAAEGRGEVDLATGRTLLLAGEVLATRLTEPPSAQAGRGVFAHLVGPLAERNLACLWENNGAPLLLGGQSATPLAGALRVLWNTLELGATVDGYWMCARAFELAALLLAGWEASQLDRPSPLVESAAVIIRNEFAYLEGIEDLADRLGVSKCHLIRRFSAEMGVSPGRYLVQRRVEYAKLLLQSGQYHLETIADLVGIAGANYFCKVFRRETGLTPDAYASSVPRAPLTGSDEPLDPRLYL